MQIIHLVKYLIALLVFAVLPACGTGGGTGNTSGKLVLSPSTATVAAGTALNATATLSSISGKPVNNLQVKYVSDNINIIPDFTDPSGTSESGVSQVSLATRNVLSTAVLVKIYAVVDGIQSNSITVTVTPARLTLVPPSNTTISLTANTITNTCTAGTARLVTSGSQISFIDPSGNPVSGQRVSIAVSSITNEWAGDKVIVTPPADNNGNVKVVTFPSYNQMVSVDTDSNGIWYLPVSIDGVIPTTKGGQHVFTVNWTASAQRMGDAGLNIQYDVTGQTMLTVSCD